MQSFKLLAGIGHNGLGRHFGHAANIAIPVAIAALAASAAYAAALAPFCWRS